jgi:hypothetical protein
LTSQHFSGKSLPAGPGNIFATMLKPEEEDELIGDDSSPASACAADEPTDAASATGQADHQVR